MRISNFKENVKKKISKEINFFGVILLLILILVWQQKFIEEEFLPYLKKILWTIIGITFIICFIFIFGKIRNHILLQTVTRSFRGTKSERELVIKLLKHGISSENIFHDLYVEKQNGEFSQIDIVVLTSVGVIVFEVKDFSGWIYGDGNHSQWTKVLGYGKNKYRFYNPIMQNNKHIQDLSKNSGSLYNVPFYSIIVFYGDCVLKEVNFVPKRTYLVKPKRVMEVIKIIENENDLVYYKNRSQAIKELKKAVMNGGNFEIQKKHIMNTKEILMRIKG